MDVNTHWRIVSWRILIWRFAIDPPIRQIKVPAKFTGYTVLGVGTNFVTLTLVIRTTMIFIDCALISER